MVSDGMKITIKTTTDTANQNGMQAIDAFSIDTLPTLHPRNNTAPTGGVYSPMDKAVMINKPNWTGCMPHCTAMGRKIGTRMIKAGAVSIKVPTIKKTKNISR